MILDKLLTGWHIKFQLIKHISIILLITNTQYFHLNGCLLKCASTLWLFIACFYNQCSPTFKSFCQKVNNHSPDKVCHVAEYIILHYVLALVKASIFKCWLSVQVEKRFNHQHNISTSILWIAKSAETKMHVFQWHEHSVLEPRQNPRFWMLIS